MTEPIIQIESLSKYYGKHRGIESVTFNVNRGQIFGYLGPNGAGKTTTIRILLGFLKPDNGQAHIFGKNIKKELIQILRNIGYLPGELSMYGYLKVSEFLEYFSKLNGTYNKPYIQHLAKKFNCDLGKKISILSTGNKQKVGIILAVMNSPELIILDEPTRGLDPLIRQEFYDLLRELKAEGKTILLSSHVLSEVEKICDQAAIIKDGKIVTIENILSLRTKNYRILEITCKHPVDTGRLKSLNNISQLEVRNNVIKCHIHGDMNYLISAAQDSYIIDISSSAPGLDEIFLKFYADGENV